jgi:hypothetical protein
MSPINLVLPITSVRLTHLSPDLSLCTIICAIKNPLRGSNVSESLEFSSLLPRLGVESYIKNLLSVHAHGEVTVEIRDHEKII